MVLFAVTFPNSFPPKEEVHARLSHQIRAKSPAQERRKRGTRQVTASNSGQVGKRFCHVISAKGDVFAMSFDTTDYVYHEGKYQVII